MDLIASKQIHVKTLIDQYKDLPGGLLPLLHAIQNAFGYISVSAIADIAVGLNLSKAEVHGVVSFYHDFKTKPVGHHMVQICRAEACQSMGSRELEDHVKKALGIGYGETTPDGFISLEPVYCLGNCASSPSVRINDDVYARVDKNRFDSLVAGLEGSP